MIFSWLEELVPLFWLMELDLVSLKGSAESSSRFWGVSGFNMSFDSPSGFGNEDTSIFTALSKWPSQHIFTATSPRLVPEIFSGTAVPPVLPCTAGWSLLSRGLCWSFLGSLTLPSVLQRLVWPSFSPLSSPCMSWGLCFSFGSLARPLGCAVCVCWRGLYAAPLSWHPWPTFCTMGLPCASLGSLSPLSAHGHSPWGFYGLRSSAFSVFCPLGLCFVQFSEIPQLSLGPNYQGTSQCKGTLPASWLPASLQDRSSHLEVLHLFPFYVSILSPTSFQEVSPAPLESWGLLLSPRGCLVGVVPYLNEFLMYLWGGWQPPHLTPPPSSSAPIWAICILGKLNFCCSYSLQIFFLIP